MVVCRATCNRCPESGDLDSTQLAAAIYADPDRPAKAAVRGIGNSISPTSCPAARFRVNVMQQQGSVGAVLRTIPWDILPLSALRMPEVLGDFADLPRGLVLVTGPTGSGKSTTLAAIIDQANRTRHGHILTVEDPIEFVHPHRNCVVNQREVGQDTLSFQDALKHALRQDPDIILVGEMRDLETISIALTRRRLATSSSAPCTPAPQDPRSTASSTSSPPTSSPRSAPSWPAASRALSARRCAKRRRGAARSHRVMIATPAVET